MSLSPLTVRNRSVGKVAPVGAVRNTGSRGTATRIHNTLQLEVKGQASRFYLGTEFLLPTEKRTGWALESVLSFWIREKRLTCTGNLTKVTRFPALGLVFLHSELSRLWYVVCICVII